MRGGAGNDKFFGGGDPSGQNENGDFFIGESGLDTSIYRGSHSQYLVTKTKVYDALLDNGVTQVDGFTVQDTVQNRDGKDNLVTVERLKFSDLNVALDLTPEGNAGQAMEFIGTVAPDLLAQALAPYAPPGCDMNRVIQMLLVHDLGEIDAGDVFVYAEGDAQARHADELAGVRRLCDLLPAAQGERLLALWQEFDAGTTSEARFANALDRAMPALLNLNNRGQSWVENGVSHARVVARIGPPIREGCPALWTYLEARLAEAQAAGWYGMG